MTYKYLQIGNMVHYSMQAIRDYDRYNKGYPATISKVSERVFFGTSCAQFTNDITMIFDVVALRLMRTS